MYPSPLPHTPQSYLRSSAGQRYSPPSPQNYYHSTYNQPPALGESLPDDSPPSSASSNSGSVLGAHDEVPIQDHPHEFIPDYSNYQLASTPGNGYPTDGTSAIPRNGHIWTTDATLKQDSYPTYPSMQLLEAHAQVAPYEDPHMYQHYRDEHYVPHALTLAPYYDGQERLGADAPLGAYTTQGDLPPSVVAGFSNSPTLRGQDMPSDQMNSPPAAYISSSPSTASLHYPGSPVDAAPPSAFVNLQDVSPSPAVSPDQVCATLPLGSPTAYSFPAHSPYAVSNGSQYEYADDATPELAVPVLQRRPEARDRRPTKKHRYMSSDSESWSASTGESGESEKEEDVDDGDDDEYTPDEGRGLRSSRRRTVRRAHSRSFSPVDISKPRLGAPVPVPNLTKKSRGRRVPTSAIVVSQNGVEKNIRGYKCKVPGCNKCFQRGEHLKRHIRSIHTNEKPHKCPYKNCGKDFSRHDNLRQHMRVHRNDPLEDA
ncbi:hypothetical protein EIP86_007360 [Pleurotus ostreatoroseus]|nr:hypothetical protein EIP86_007360 [Pleurotus ostreatoroseus]